MSESSANHLQKKIYGNNYLFCNIGILGKKYYNMIFAFLLYTLPYVALLIILIFEKSHMEIISPIIITTILYIFTVISEIMGGFSDPGILPRQGSDYFYHTDKPSLRYIINGHLYKLNYCFSCSLFRPPRTSHCSTCDNCVRRFDHHCIWLGTCIGERNYRYFYTLIGLLNISAIYQICYSLYYIIFSAKKFKNKEDYNKMILWGLTAVSMYNLLFMIFFIGKLFILHTYLVFNSITFYEDIKKKFKKIPGYNTFKKYLLYTWKRIVCHSPPKSFLISFLNKKQFNSNDKNSVNEQNKEEEKEEKIFEPSLHNISTKNNNDVIISDHDKNNDNTISDENKINEKNNFYKIATNKRIIREKNIKRKESEDEEIKFDEKKLKINFENKRYITPLEKKKYKLNNIKLNKVIEEEKKDKKSILSTDCNNKNIEIKNVYENIIHTTREKLDNNDISKNDEDEIIMKTKITYNSNQLENDI